jgi:methyltransferase (TIGR00027 family)
MPTSGNSWADIEFLMTPVSQTFKTVEPHRSTLKGASRTAELVAVVRAAHFRHRGGRLFADPVAERLLSRSWRLVAKYRPLFWVMERIVLAKVRHVQTQILLRAKIASEQVMRASLSGASQYMILGAGYDSFALTHALHTDGLQVFEVDHPQTQASKRQRLADSGLAVPDSLQFVAVDFENQDLTEVVLGSAWDTGKKSIVSWLGTTYYLSQQAIEKNLRQLHGLLPYGSLLILDHGLNNASLDIRTVREYENLREFVAKRGEPMISQFSPQVFRRMTSNCGFAVRRVWTPQQLHSMCKGLPFSGFSQFVLLERV